ncbi:MAG: transcription antitermination factor NusB [Bacilli bacterium]|jgi:N utilization substance protein B|nr:transcription antitermination factor NusB [Bacilli bacterium]MDD2681772.1 transcription antitermination factor NusB [Bacilli bacterium]MDD3121614.1 transcription antitermination factor NusB [Bacilli bacterium]MDD4062973.1 transcription antitermination factor NusB [Bacilli bacterium]MDD4482331.1 transcription antitermination factor NusB [Bacilli bacterium]
MKRNISRIKAMMVLYSKEINENYEELNALYDLDIDLQANEDFVNELVLGVSKYKKEIDFIISTNLEHYTISRLNFVDQAIIRIAVYEMKYTNTPHNIIINEALEISHEYSETMDDQSSKFNNSVLDKISKKIS